MHVRNSCAHTTTSQCALGVGHAHSPSRGMSETWAAELYVHVRHLCSFVGVVFFGHVALCRVSLFFAHQQTQQDQHNKHLAMRPHCCCSTCVQTPMRVVVPVAATTAALQSAEACLLRVFALHCVLAPCLALTMPCECCVSTSGAQ